MSARRSLQGYQPRLPGALLIIVLWLLSVVLGRQFVHAFALPGEELGALLGTALGSFAFLFVYGWLTGQTPSRLLRPPNARGNAALGEVLAPLLALSFGDALLTCALDVWFRMSDVGFADPITGYPGKTLDAHFLIALTSEVALFPLVEELVFRGIVLRGLLQHHTPLIAILLSAALFGLMHIEWPLVCYSTLGGVLYGWIYWRTRALWPCILAHVFNNAFVELVWLPMFEFTVRGVLLALVAGLVLLMLGIRWLAVRTSPQSGVPS